MSPREASPDGIFHRAVEDDHDGSSSDGSSSNKRSRVTFGEIKIREFNRVVGDHPETKVGPPLSLSWEHRDLPGRPLDDYELARPLRKRSLRLNSVARRNILVGDFQVDEEDIAMAEREAQRIQQQREESANGGRAANRIERKMKAVKRIFMKRSGSGDSAPRESLFMGFAAASGSMMPLGMGF